MPNYISVFFKKLQTCFLLLVLAPLFCLGQTGPAGVGNCRLWLRADRGTFNGGTDRSSFNWGKTTRWVDQKTGGTDNSTTGFSTSPYKVTNKNFPERRLNYNPAILFDQDLDMLSGPDLGLGGTTKMAEFIVIQMADSPTENYSATFSLGNSTSSNMHRLENATTTNDFIFFDNNYTGNLACGAKNNTQYNQSIKACWYDAAAGVDFTGAHNGEIVSTLSTSNTITASGGYKIGNIESGSANNTFSIGEIIIFRTDLNQNKRYRVQTYLAIKYGVTLSHNYIKTDNAVVYDVSTYNNDIIGIARDDGSDFEQKQSHQLHDKDSTRIYLNVLEDTNLDNNGSFTSDQQFLIMGHNNDALNGNSHSTEYPTGLGIFNRIEREWKLTNTNFSGTTFSIDTKLENTPIDVNHLRLLVDSDDGDFTNSTLFNPSMSYASGVLTISGLDISTFPINTTRYFTIVSINSLTPLSTKSFTWTGATDTDWATGSNWNIGTVPVVGANIIIPNVTNQPLLDQDRNIGSLTLNISADVDLNGFNLSLNEDFTNDGNLIANNGTLSFVGTTNSQSIIANSNLSLYNLIINNSNGVSLSNGAINLGGTLTLTDGLFNTNNSITLLSNSSGTARIAEITGGSITGNITMQRYINAGLTDWRFLTSATSGMTLQQYSGDFETSGFLGAQFPNWPTAASPWPSIYFYDETVAGAQDNGFTAATNIANSVAPGEGLWVYCGDTITGTQPFLVDMTGPVNTGNINLPVSFTSSPHSDDGWNMVGNPYPSTIDWDDAGISKTSINNAIYIWNPDLGQFASYINGVGTNGGSKNIASSQAFWVQATSGSANIQVTEAAKTTDGGAFLKTSSLLNIEAVNSNGKDETVVNFEANATTGFDAAYDAYKMPTVTQGLPNISTVMQGNIDLSINQLMEQTIDIPLKVITTASGIHNLNISGVGNFTNASYIVLEDLFTGNIYDLNTVSSVTVLISDTTQVARFLIKFGYNITEVEDIVTGNSIEKPIVWSYDNQLLVKGSDIEKVTVRNILGQILFRASNEKKFSFNLSELSSQILIVEVNSSGISSSTKVNFIKL